MRLLAIGVGDNVPINVSLTFDAVCVRILLCLVKNNFECCGCLDVCERVNAYFQFVN